METTNKRTAIIITFEQKANIDYLQACNVTKHRIKEYFGTKWTSEHDSGIPIMLVDCDVTEEDVEALERTTCATLLCLQTDDYTKASSNKIIKCL